VPATTFVRPRASAFAKTVRSAWLAAFVLGALGCSRSPTRATQEPRANARAQAADGDDARTLARLLPAPAERCSVSLPTRVSRARRALLAQASYSERLPWSLDLDVLAYARADRSDPSGTRISREYVRFATVDRTRVVAELERALARPIVWDGVPSAREPCEGELTCVPVEARFVDARTVELARGAWLHDRTAESACVGLLIAHPTALEVSLRENTVTGSELRDTTAVLAFSGDGVERTISKRYASEQAAERASSAARRGEDELPSLSGSGTSEPGRRRGDRIEQRVLASFDELELAAHDQQRARALAGELDAPRPLGQLEPGDSEAVRAAFDRALPTLRRAGPTGAEAARWLELLARAQAAAPSDDGLARRLYQLQLSVRGDARAAHAVAERSLHARLGEAAAWELAQRAALAHFDAERLRVELARAHQLPVDQARRMADELASKVAGGHDYERAEWAYLTARGLASAARKLKRSTVALRLPLNELARTLALLAQASDEHGDLGVHLLALGALVDLPQAQAIEALWSERTIGGGRPGLVLAASTWDDVPLRALGRALALQTSDGPLTLAIGLERIGARTRTTLVLTGRRQGAELVVDQLSRSLRGLAWERLARLLVAPLTQLQGALYPPDELTIVAEDGDEAVAVRAAAESEARIVCTTEGLTVRCRGPLADQGAARRALLAVVRRVLARDARSLWSDEAL
jgi:hypothetical protein